MTRDEVALVLAGLANSLAAARVRRLIRSGVELGCLEVLAEAGEAMRVVLVVASQSQDPVGAVRDIIALEEAL